MDAKRTRIVGTKRKVVAGVQPARGVKVEAFGICGRQVRVERVPNPMSGFRAQARAHRIAARVFDFLASAECPEGAVYVDNEGPSVRFEAMRDEDLPAIEEVLLKAAALEESRS